MNHLRYAVYWRSASGRWILMGMMMNEAIAKETKFTLATTFSGPWQYRQFR